MDHSSGRLHDISPSIGPINYGDRTLSLYLGFFDIHIEANVGLLFAKSTRDPLSCTLYAMRVLGTKPLSTV